MKEKKKKKKSGRGEVGARVRKEEGSGEEGRTLLDEWTGQPVPRGTHDGWKRLEAEAGGASPVRGRWRSRRRCFVASTSTCQRRPTHRRRTSKRRCERGKGKAWEDASAAVQAYLVGKVVGRGGWGRRAATLHRDDGEGRGSCRTCERLRKDVGCVRKSNKAITMADCVCLISHAQNGPKGAQGPWGGLFSAARAWQRQSPPNFCLEACQARSQVSRKAGCAEAERASASSPWGLGGVLPPASQML